MILDKAEGIQQAAKSETRTGGETKLEKLVEMYLGNGIHLFLSLLALLIFIAAMITTWDTVMRDFPQLWQPVNEYVVLQKLIESILLIAIAAELALLLIFHRTTAVVEVMIFVIARKMVSPDTTIVGLLIGTVAVIGLIVVRFYFLPGRVK